MIRYFGGGGRKMKLHLSHGNYGWEIEVVKVLPYAEEIDVYGVADDNPTYKKDVWMIYKHEGHLEALPATIIAELMD